MISGGGDNGWTLAIWCFSVNGVIYLLIFHGGMMDACGNLVLFGVCLRVTTFRDKLGLKDMKITAVFINVVLICI